MGKRTCDDAPMCARARHRTREVPCPTPRLAGAIAGALDVDVELRPREIRRRIDVDGAVITV